MTTLTPWFRSPDIRATRHPDRPPSRWWRAYTVGNDVTVLSGKVPLSPAPGNVA